MCIICLKPAGVDLPSDDEIKYMFEHNPHGAGFAIQGDTRGDGVFRVEYHKGFMNVDDLLEALGPREKLKNLTVAIHCRIKTSGETDKYTTHPFPISNQYADLRKTDGEGAVLFHNGIFSGLGGIINPNSSDTQDFVVGVASRYLKNARMPRKISQAIVSKIAGDCRVLIMYPKENFPILRFGTWHEHKGCLYSNLNYKDNDYSKYTYSNYYHQRTSTSNLREDIDEWGCNVAEFAWPNMNDDWIRFDDRRWETVSSQMKDKETKNGEHVCKFSCTGEKEWIVDEDFKEIYTAKVRDQVALRQDEETFLAINEEDANLYSEKDYIWFNDIDSMQSWLEMCEKVGEFEFKFGNKVWYINMDNCEAFTEEGLKKYYEPGEVGHVRKALKKTGTYIEHTKSAKYMFPDDEEEYDQKLLDSIYGVDELDYGRS